MVSKNEFDIEIQNIVGQIIDLYKPERIILFGSLVKDKINEGTDIDLFIVKNDVPDCGVERIRQLDTLIKYKIATDFIVYKTEELQERLRLGDPFIKSILEDGKVLYNAA